MYFGLPEIFRVNLFHSHAVKVNDDYLGHWSCFSETKKTTVVSASWRCFCIRIKEKDVFTDSKMLFLNSFHENTAL